MNGRWALETVMFDVSSSITDVLWILCGLRVIELLAFVELRMFGLLRDALAATARKHADEGEKEREDKLLHSNRRKCIKFERLATFIAK